MKKYIVTSNETVYVTYKQEVIAENEEQAKKLADEDGDIVEIHTEKTLRKEYQGTNLFDKEEGKLVNDAMFAFSIFIDFSILVFSFLNHFKHFLE